MDKGKERIIVHGGRGFGHQIRALFRVLTKETAQESVQKSKADGKKAGQIVIDDVREQMEKVKKDIREFGHFLRRPTDQRGHIPPVSFMSPHCGFKRSWGVLEKSSHFSILTKRVKALSCRKEKSQSKKWRKYKKRRG